jgi:hypothetical protein
MLPRTFDAEIELESEKPWQFRSDASASQHLRDALVVPA